MKKQLLVSILLVFTNILVGQTEKGKFTFSGGTGLQFTSTNIEYEYDGESFGDIDKSSFSIMAGAGYFVMDNLSLGLSTTFSSTTTKDEGDKYTVKSTILMPMVSYYFPVEGNFRPFLQAGAGLASNVEEEDYDGSTDTYKMSGLAYGFGGGASYFINNYISIDFGLAYTVANLKDSDDSDWVQKGQSFGGVVGFSLFF